MKKLRAALAVGVALAVIGAGCSWFDEKATAGPDVTTCVYKQDKDGGGLRFQMVPNETPKPKETNDKEVDMPTSGRFYAASKDNEVRDPGAPFFYTGNAKGGAEIQVQGQVLFRFNIEAACDWYDRHGRRNLAGFEDLGFNARGAPEEVKQYGWFLFLNGRFGVTMQEIVSERSPFFRWPALIYNTAVNADDAGVLPPGEEAGPAARRAYGIDLSKAFNERLNENLGGDPDEPFFCGTTPVEDPVTECPPITFQVFDVEITDTALIKSKDALETERQRLATQAVKDQLAAANQAALLRAENTKQVLAKKRILTAKLEAQGDVKFQRCLVYAKLGLDCDGKHPINVVAGASR